jgi:hypothetical protein
MAQYWIQIPVENAKEVVQRKIDELVVNWLPDYAGYTVSYDENCEVVLDGNSLNGNPPQDPNYIYFGTWVVNVDNTFTSYLYINDPNFNPYPVVDFLTYPPKAGHYPYIIWNYVDFPAPQDGYFFGYKFTLTPPAV